MNTIHTCINRGRINFLSRSAILCRMSNSRIGWVLKCEFMLLHDQSNAMQNVSSNITNYICPWFINSAGCEDFTYPDIQGICVEKKCSFYPSNVNLNMVDIHHSVFTSRQLNFACCKIYRLVY
jgi:hypothetical protein